MVRARNLLELSVWSLYCAKDRTHARRLYEDAGRDVLGIYSAFEKWGTATVLSSRAAADGTTSLDGEAVDERCGSNCLECKIICPWHYVSRLGARRCGQSLTHSLCDFLVYGIVPEDVEILVSAKVQQSDLSLFVGRLQISQRLCLLAQ